MGCHIEMTRRHARDYPLGAKYQPDEPPLEMTVRQLIAFGTRPRRLRTGRASDHYDDFIIFNEPGRREQRRLAARARFFRRIWPMR